jgi:hypothetical protein
VTGSAAQAPPRVPPDQDDPDNLESLWRWLTVPLFLYCAGLWIRSQSNNFEVLSLIAKDHDVAIVTGLFATPLAFVSLWLGARYARLCAARSTAERVPRLIEKGLEGKTGRVFRLGLFFGVWVVILGSQIHFAQTVLTGSVLDTTPKPNVMLARGAAAMLTTWPPAQSRSHDFRFGSEHGPTYFPVIQTWLCLCAVAVLVASFLWYVFARLRVLKRSGSAHRRRR